jgi:hypothetical protein
VRDFFVGSMVFGIVHQICIVVPGYDVALFIAVLHQHAAFEHFAQTGAALHHALCWHCSNLFYGEARVSVLIQICSS